MKKIATLCLCLALSLAILAALPCQVLAADQNSQSGVQAVLTTDKEVYKAEEPVKLSLSITNGNSVTLDELSVDTQLPEGLSFVGQGLELSGAVLEAGKGLELSSTLAAEPAKTTPDSQQPAQETEPILTIGATETGEEESSSTLIIVAIVLGGLIVVTGALLVIVRRKKAVKALCLLLCMALLLPSLPLQAKAEAPLTLSKTITVGDNDYLIEVSIGFSIPNEVIQTQSDTALPSPVQQIYGVAPNETDADGDGLSNYIEIYVTGTDPNLTDTDGNGVADAQEDADGDGITNGEELLRGMNPGSDDTDKDGISDGEELLERNTNPCAPDSDQDGLSDGDEVVLGLNPLTSKTDGTVADAQRTFTQSLSDHRMDERLTDEANAAQPSLTLTTTGNINSRVSLTPVDSYVFTDSRALVGEVVELKGSDLGEGSLTFTLGESSTATEGDFDPNLICKYNEDGTVTYLDTTYDAATHSISAPVSESGTYYVMDVAALFADLGLELPTAGGSVSGSTTTVADQKNAARTTVPADIVFVIDSTASMGDEIANVRANLSSFMNVLKAKGISAQLALVDYQDFTEASYLSTTVHKNGTSNWFTDLNTFTNVLTGITLGDGGDSPECVVDALETARLLDLRSAAGKYFILVTDAPYKEANRYNIPDLEAEIQLLNNAQISCCVISPPELQALYSPLFTKTSGFWSDIYSDFSSDLTTLADSIGNQIVGDGYWIYLQGPVPVPVRLDAEPTYGSNVDTDGDGISDYLELGGADPTGYVDLDELITTVSKGVITGTSYGVVMTYEHQSDPTLMDSDYDGIIDVEDSAPLNNSFTGVFHYYNDQNKANVEFNVDYSLLCGDNTVYRKDLSVFAMLCAGNIYSDCYVEVKTGTKGGGYDPTLFTQLFGLEDVEDIHIVASDYDVDKDDLSEFVVGHKTIRHGGIDREIIILTVRGTNATNAEWSSNFDVGADSANYYQIMGESHPDWVNKGNHKGFDVATNRILTKFYDYIQRHGLEDTPNKTILISGHSRGASISNLLGAHFEDNLDYTSFTYTFATPFSTTDPNAESYKTVFNIVNEDDMIPFMPLSDWGFKKYGTTKSISVNKYYEDDNPFGDAEGSFEWLTGVDYNDNGGIANCLKSFSDLVKTRDDLYVIDTSTDGVVNIGNTFHTTLSGAEKRKTELATELEGVKLLRFVRLDVVDGIIKHVNTTYCPAYLMQNLANMASSTGPLTGYDVKGKYATAKSNFVTCYLSGMTHPHEQVTYYLIARNNLEPLS